MNDQETYQITDFNLGIWLKYRGKKLLRLTSSEKPNQVIMVFEDKDNTAQDIIMDYSDSEFARYDNIAKVMKKQINEYLRNVRRKQAKYNR